MGTRQPRFYVSGNWGSLEACAKSGKVIECYDSHDTTDKTGENYHGITSFDVDEWRKRYPNNKLEESSLDILDIGFHDEQGYCEPEEEWRKEREANL